MRETLSSAVSVKAKLSCTNATFYSKADSNKKISLSEKWRERRKEIEKKKNLVQQKEF